MKQMVTGAGLLCPVLLLFAYSDDTSFTTKASWYGKPDGKGGYVDCGNITAYGKRYDSSKLVCDLSLGAFRKLCSPSAGLITVTVKKI
mgnify:CR=1 FL=1